MYTKVKTDSEIAAMRESGRMLATVLDNLKGVLSVGMTTKDLSHHAANELKKMGGQPAFLGYQGFPDVLCVSVNQQVVHGIPNSEKVIQDGDIVSMDFGVLYLGMITDAAISCIAGTTTSSDKQLVETTKQSLLAGIDHLKNGVRIGEISHAIETVLRKGGYGVVRDLVGHGVGHQLHEEPNIPNYGSPKDGPVLKSGMTVAIEPMATQGTHEVYIAPDKWTVLTKDGSRAAHFEHTVLVTDTGYDILTSL